MGGFEAHDTRYKEIQYYLTERNSGKHKKFHAEITEGWISRSLICDESDEDFIYEFILYNDKTGESIIELSDGTIDSMTSLDEHIKYVNNVLNKHDDVKIRTTDWKRICGCDRCDGEWGETSLDRNNRLILLE